MANYGSRRGSSRQGRQPRQNQERNVGFGSRRVEYRDFDNRKQVERKSGEHESRVRPRPGRRGFASMDEEQQREIASMGGRAAHEYGTAHEFSSEEAQKAGRRGGQRTRKNHGRGFYQEIGRMGGEERRRELGPKGYSELGRMGGRSRWEQDRRVSRSREEDGRIPSGPKSNSGRRSVSKNSGRTQDSRRSTIGRKPLVVGRSHDSRKSQDGRRAQNGRRTSRTNSSKIK